MDPNTIYRAIAFIATISISFAACLPSDRVACDPSPAFSSRENGLAKDTSDDVSNSRNVVAFEFAGIGRGFAFEYERRLQRQFAGLGIRGGVGIAAGDITYTSFPVQLNYLLKCWEGYFDLGAGATFMRNNDLKGHPEYEIGTMYAPYATRWTTYGTINLSYRFVDKKSIFRLGFTYYYGYGHSYYSPGFSFEGCW